MTTARLDGKHVAILATDGVEQSLLVEPREALLTAGATALVISPRPGTITAYRHDLKGKELQVDVPLSAARPDEYDALLVPGGVLNADRLRLNHYAVDFVRAFMATRRPIGMIGHAPWVLIQADEIEGRTLTSYPSLKTDLRNAGATWVDREVWVDGMLITCRRPDDVPSFCARFIEQIAACEPATAGAGVASSLPHVAPSSGPGGLPRYGSMGHEPPPYHSMPISVPSGGMQPISPYMRQR